MTRYNSLFLLAPLLFCIFWLSSLVFIHQKEVTAFNSWVLQKQVNYAADAAAEELRVYSENSGLDYMTETIEVDTSYAVDEFESVLCKELGYESTSDYKAYVGRNYIKCLFLCTERGFYPYFNQPVRYADFETRDPAEIDDASTHTGYRKSTDSSADYATVKELVAYPMQPYVGTFNISLIPSGSEEASILKPGQEYAVTLACNKIYTCEYADSTDDENPIIQGVTTIKNENMQVVTPEEGTVLQMRQIINHSVENFLRSVIYTTYNNDQASTVILPSGLDTIHGGNGITGPCVLAVVDTSQQANFYNALFGIGGTTIKETDYVLAWKTTDGHRYWVSTSMLKHAGYDIKDGKLIDSTTGSEVDSASKIAQDLAGIANAKVYNSPFKAADAGYDMYWGVMGEQKWKD